MLIYKQIAFWKQGEDTSVQVCHQCCGDICYSPSFEVMGLRLSRGAHVTKDSFPFRKFFLSLPENILVLGSFLKQPSQALQEQHTAPPPASCWNFYPSASAHTGLQPRACPGPSAWAGSCGSAEDRALKSQPCPVLLTICWWMKL